MKDLDLAHAPTDNLCDQIRSFHNIHNNNNNNNNNTSICKAHNVSIRAESEAPVVDRVVLRAMWEELAGKVGHRDQLIIC